ncbi:MAG TPA: hypothetical protein VFH22_15600, partial [Rhodocyclaceae bacterium]|nr:hypothetical protein [Rhodocyclaceae bacterium]
MASQLSPIKHALVGAIVALALPLAHAAVPDSTSVGAAREYVRLHDSAVAFADTAAKLSGRYEGLRTADLAGAQDLISQSEAAARQRDFDAASSKARQAYEKLR